MTNRIFFADHPDVLPDVFLSGVRSFFVKREAHERPVALFFPQSDGLNVEVCCVMHDVAPRFEVGALCFKRVEGPLGFSEEVVLPDGFQKVRKVEKLLFEDEMISAESGVLITGENGLELVIAAGEFPYAVEFWFDGYEGDFRPEYDMREYRRVNFI